MEKIFVTGVAGQLGFDVIRELRAKNIPCVGSDILATNANFEETFHIPYTPLDITNAEEVDKVFERYAPSVVVHCAAWTNVDLAETHVRDAYNINAFGTLNIASACKKHNAKLIYISTDYVFNGSGDTPWESDCQDYAPLNAYGHSKLVGELCVSKTLEKFFIVRIAWVFGKNGNNFIKTMLKLSERFKEIRVVDDQIGTPTYTFDLAKLLVQMTRSEKYGYYHATNSGAFISWADFAKEIFKQAKKSTKVIPVTTEEYGKSVAKRPFNSRLSKTKLSENGFEQLPSWESAIERYLKEINV